MWDNSQGFYFSELIKSLDKKETMCEGLIYKIWAIERWNFR